MWLKNFCGYNIFAPFCLTISLIFELLPHLLSPSFFLFLLVYLSFIFLMQFVCCLPFFFVSFDSEIVFAALFAQALGPIFVQRTMLRNWSTSPYWIVAKVPSPPSLPLFPPCWECLHCATSREKSKRVDWRRKRLNNNIVASFLLGKQKCLEKYV